MTPADSTARVCAANGCTTELSSYNVDDRCSVHQHEMTEAERATAEGLCQFEGGCQKQAWKGKAFCREHAGGVTREERVEAAVNLRRTAGLTNEEIAKRLDVSVASVGTYLWEGGAARVPTKAQADAKAAAEARREERQFSEPRAPQRAPTHDTVLEAVRAGFRKRRSIMGATSLDETTVSNALAQLRAADEIVMVGHKAGARYLLPGEDAESEDDEEETVEASTGPEPGDEEPQESADDDTAEDADEEENVAAAEEQETEPEAAAPVDDRTVRPAFFERRPLECPHPSELYFYMLDRYQCALLDKFEKAPGESTHAHHWADRIEKLITVMGIESDAALVYPPDEVTVFRDATYSGGVEGAS